MKLNKPRYALIPIFVIVALTISSFNYANSLKPEDLSDEAWCDSIAAALQTSHIIQIHGDIFIVDSIPCSSAVSNVGFWTRLKGQTYVDCTTCKPRSGKPDPKSDGSCTVIRKYNENQQ